MEGRRGCFIQPLPNPQRRPGNTFQERRKNGEEEKENSGFAGVSNRGKKKGGAVDDFQCWNAGKTPPTLPTKKRGVNARGECGTC